MCYAKTYITLPPLLMSSPLVPNPLSFLGKLDARYFTVQLHGVIPVSAETAASLDLRAPLGDMSPSAPSAPARLSAPHSTLSATFTLLPHKIQQRSAQNTLLHLPYLPRNALLLTNIKTLTSTPTTPQITPHTDTSSPPVRSDIPANFPHTPPDQSPSAHTRIYQYPTSRISSPLLPYPVAGDQLEFFPLSSLQLPHLNTPEPQQATDTSAAIDLTQWFVAECLASSITYTSLLSDPASPSAHPTPNQVATDAGISPNTKLHTYHHLDPYARRFWFGGDAHTALITSTLLPSSRLTYTPDTAHLTVADIIHVPEGTPPDLAPPRLDTWFKLTATPRPLADPDVGTLAATHNVEDPDRNVRTYPAQMYARWVDYSLTTSSAPVGTTYALGTLPPAQRTYLPNDNTWTFDAPYFSPTSRIGALLYSHVEQASDYDYSVENPDEQACLDTRHSLAHSLPHITKAAMLKEARDYALTLSNQRQYALSARLAEHPASVVYSDRLCFTRSGMYKPDGVSEQLLTRVAQIEGFKPATPAECVVTENQYSVLHQLAARYARDATMVGHSMSELDSHAAEDLPALQFVSTHTKRKLPSKQHAVSVRAPNSMFGTAIMPATAASLLPRGRGRPAGSRNRIVNSEQFGQHMKSIGIMADSVLRIAAQSFFSGFKKKILDIHNPTSDWTRLTPLMPPASHTSLANNRYGRALPIRAVNNQHIDSLLWRSLLNKWVNYSQYERIKTNRPPIVQITKLVDPLDKEATDAIPYHHDTQFAYATIFIPVPASVMYSWLTTGPTPYEIDAVLPRTADHAPAEEGKPEPVRKGYYDDPRITINERSTFSGTKFEHEVHEQLPDYPEQFTTYGVATRPTNEVATATLPQPGPTTSGALPPNEIPLMINLTPRS